MWDMWYQESQLRYSVLHDMKDYVERHAIGMHVDTTLADSTWMRTNDTMNVRERSMISMAQLSGTL